MKTMLGDYIGEVTLYEISCGFVIYHH